jgi:hypothetical protein
MGRPCKGLHLSPSHLCSLEELSTQAKSLGLRQGFHWIRS